MEPVSSKPTMIGVEAGCSSESRDSRMFWPAALSRLGSSFSCTPVARAE